MGVIRMIEMYYTLVINKRRTCNEKTTTVPQVPPNLKNDVANMLKDNGYDLDGNLSK